MNRRSKYAPLAVYLRESGKATVTMTEKNFGNVVGGGLPPVAWRRREWWANEESADSRHVQCRDGWRAGGYQVSTVDLAARVVTFVRQL